MKKRIALISDIHDNLETLESILEDIKTKNIDEIICLGDTIDIGSNSKECIDLLIENNVESVLGDCEIYLLRNDFNSITYEEKEHYKCVKESLTDKEISYTKKCPLYYEVNINYDNSVFNKKYILCHYLINDEKDIYPFEKRNLRRNIDLWKKYNNDGIIYFVGHLHNSFNVNEVDGIAGDYIEDDETLTNIEVVDSAGCTRDEYTYYMILEIGKSTIFRRQKLKYDRDKFIRKKVKNNLYEKNNSRKFK